MNDAQLENIFAPRLAVTPNRSYPGPGLHLIHSIIESYQGKIRIKSTPDQGTTVDIYFPAYGSENEERVCLADTLEMPTGTERIMLVDDEKTIVNFLMHLLKSLGYDTVVKTDLKEAIGTFQAAPDAFDLVLTDISMTHMTGNILVKELKRIRKDIPIVLCSEFTEKISISHEMATDPDIDAVIMKPVVKSELANVIRRVLDRHAC